MKELIRSFNATTTCFYCFLNYFGLTIQTTFKNIRFFYIKVILFYSEHQVYKGLKLKKKSLNTLFR